MLSLGNIVESDKAVESSIMLSWLHLVCSVIERWNGLTGRGGPACVRLLAIF